MAQTIHSVLKKNTNSHAHSTDSPYSLTGITGNAANGRSNSRTATGWRFWATPSSSGCRSTIIWNYGLPRLPDRNITFRNLGWSGDTPRGVSRAGLSLQQAGREPADEGWKQLQKQITLVKPTVVFLGYGMASSFENQPEQFGQDMRALKAAVGRRPAVRFVLWCCRPAS